MFFLLSLLSAVLAVPQVGAFNFFLKSVLEIYKLWESDLLGEK